MCQICILSIEEKVKFHPGYFNSKLNHVIMKVFVL